MSESEVTDEDRKRFTALGYRAVLRVDAALRYIREHKDAGNNATLFHLSIIENILLGLDDGLPTNAEDKSDA